MRVSKMRDVTRAKLPSLCGAIWRTILNFYASQGVWVNCYRIHQKSSNFIYPFKFYSNFTNENVSWLHFSWATQYIFTPYLTRSDPQQNRPTHFEINSSITIYSVPVDNSRTGCGWVDWFNLWRLFARVIAICSWWSFWSLSRPSFKNCSVI